MATASVTNTLVDGTTIEVNPLNTNFNDLVTFLNTDVVHKDGSVAMTGALAMGSQKITGLANGTAAGDAVNKSQLDTKENTHSHPYLPTSGGAMSGHLDPASDNAIDLGDATTSWRNLYVHTIRDEAGNSRIDLNVRSLLGGDWSIAGDLDATDVRASNLLSSSGVDIGNQVVVNGNGSIGSPAFNLNANGGIWTNVTNSILLSGQGSPGITLRVSGNGGFFGPNSSAGTTDLGQVNNRWARMYAVNASDISSDLRDKDYSPLSYGLAEVLAIDPIEFTWKPELERDSDLHLGFGAQDVQGLIPEVVRANTEGDPDDPDSVGDGHLSLSIEELVPVLWRAVQELSAEVEALKAG